MKFKLKLALALLITGSWMSNVNAQGCGIAGRPFGNTTLGSFGPYTGMVPGTDIFVTTYDIAAPAANNSGTCTSAAIFPTLAGNRGINSSWVSACNTGCLASGAGRMVGLVSNQVGAGTAAHDGQFVAATAAWNAAANKWNLDLVTNGNGGTAGCPGGIACQVRPISIPTVGLSADPGAGSTYNRALGTGLVRVTFTQPAINGFFDSAPATPLITGYEVRQINVPDTTCGVTAGPTPTTTTLASWGAVLATSPAGGITNADCAAGSCTKLVQVTAIPACNRASFALDLIGGTFPTSFVSANSPSSLAGPTATTGLPSRVEVFNQTTTRIPGVQVRWTTTNETDIAGFNIFASRTSSGGYKQMNDSQIAASGSANTYLQTISSRSFISALGRGDTYYLKLVTVLRDGSTREVGPTSFALPSPEPRDRTGKGGGRN